MLPSIISYPLHLPTQQLPSRQATHSHQFLRKKKKKEKLDPESIPPLQPTTSQWREANLYPITPLPTHTHIPHTHPLRPIGNSLIYLRDSKAATPSARSRRRSLADSPRGGGKSPKRQKERRMMRSWRRWRRLRFGRRVRSLLPLHYLFFQPA